MAEAPEKPFSTPSAPVVAREGVVIGCHTETACRRNQWRSGPYCALFRHPISGRGSLDPIWTQKAASAAALVALNVRNPNDKTLKAETAFQRTAGEGRTVVNSLSSAASSISLEFCWTELPETNTVATGHRKRTLFSAAMAFERQGKE